MKIDLEEENTVNYNTPEFLKEEKEITASEKGTLIHLVLQNLDEKVDYTKEKVDTLLETMERKNIIKPKERKLVDIDKVYGFTKSNIWEELKTAKEVQKEKPFYINIPAREIYGEEIEEAVLVQGIIDLYYVDKNDNLVLVDYKTDYVEKGKERDLIGKYKKQLEIYKQALEAALNRKVAKTYIYSVYLGKALEVIEK